VVFGETVELDGESASMELGRLEESIIAGHDEMDESSLLRGAGWVGLVNEDEVGIGDELWCRERANVVAPLENETCCAWAIAGAEEFRFSLLRWGLWLWCCLDELLMLANCGVEVKA
jgi:hypothetical protein